MAVTLQERKTSCSIKLNFGTSETGARITKNVSLGSLKTNAFDPQKAYNIVNALANVFERSVYEVTNTVTNLLAEGD